MTNPIAAQAEAKRFIQQVLHVYEASVMLEEAQCLIDTQQDYRKAAMATRYISDHLSKARTPTLQYFESIVDHKRLDGL